MPGILPSELEALDAQISAQLDLLRHESNVSAKVLVLIEQMRKDLIAKLSAGNLTDFSKTRLNAILKDTTTTIDAYYARAQEVLRPSQIGAATAAATASVAGLPETIAATIPSRKVLESLVSDMLIEGAPSSAWWKRQSQDTAFRFANAVRQGIAQGETNEQIYRRTKEITDLAGRNSRALVHTSIMQAASDAREATIIANQDIYKGFRHLSTLDSRTCWSKDTLILMSDGSHKEIGCIEEGDFVIGGVSGMPCKVVGKEKTIEPSSVEICYNGNIIGRTTHAHRVLTRTGWKHIGDICLLPDISEREVLCRGNGKLKEAVHGTRHKGWHGIGVRSEQCMEKTREAGDVSNGNCGKLRGRIQSGEAINNFTENESPSRIQHDGRRGGSCRKNKGISCCSGDEIVSEVQERTGIQGANEKTGDLIRPKSVCCEQEILFDGGGPQIDGGQVCIGLEEKHSKGKFNTRNQSGSKRDVECSNKGELGGSEIQGEGECSARCEASRIEGYESGMGRSENGKGEGVHVKEMERPCISCQDEGTEACSSTKRSQNKRTGKTDTTRMDTGNENCALGESQIRFGKEEEVSVGHITGKKIDGDIEIISLSIEGDHSYVAGELIVHNTDICMARSNLEWDFDHNPIGHTLQWNPPPSHWNCRSVLAPIRKTFRELGIDADEPTGRTRASAEGQIDRETSFDSFLKRRTKEQQDEQLGKGRADMFRNGKITLRQLLDNAGNTLTLDELRAKYG